MTRQSSIILTVENPDPLKKKKFNWQVCIWLTLNELKKNWRNNTQMCSVTGLLSVVCWAAIIIRWTLKSRRGRTKWCRTTVCRVEDRRRASETGDIMVCVCAGGAACTWNWPIYVCRCLWDALSFCYLLHVRSEHIFYVAAVLSKAKFPGDKRSKSLILKIHFPALNRRVHMIWSLQKLEMKTKLIK